MAALYLFALITVTCLLVPLFPSMPAQGLDPSWHYGLNQAVAQGLSFGQEIVFTYGPYSSIYTRAYHPATDGLMVWGGLYFSLVFALALCLALKEYPVRYLLILVLGFAFVGAVPHALFSPRDPFFFLYPLFVSAYLCGGFSRQAALGPALDLFATGLLLSVFGLIALTKISIFLLCGACLAVILAHFIWRREYARAFVALFSPAVTLVLLWVLSGQSILNLPFYFRSMVPIVSGYSDAMSLDGEPSDIIAYLVVFAAVLWVLLTERIRPHSTRVALVVIFSLAMLVVFKASFVRHDNHAFMAGNFVILTGLLLTVALPSRRSVLALAAGCLGFLVIVSNHLSIKSIFEPGNMLSVYTSAWRGLEVRSAEGNTLLDSFEKARLNLEAKAGIPTLPGTSDIYSWEQSRLLATDNTWNPRPTFQSYTVYTPSLARANNEHLRGERAPDNILFKIHPIDDRLPALEDGASWVSLLTNYQPVAVESERLLLENRQVDAVDAMNFIAGDEKAFNELITVPDTAAIVHSRISVRKSLLGSLVNLAYKASPLEITLHMKNGAEERYRFVAGMAQEGILISPLIRSAEEFELLYVGQQMLLDKRVASFSIAPTRWPLLWHNSVDVEFNAVDEGALGRAEGVSGLEKPAPHTGVEPAAAETCRGEISYLNGFPPSADHIPAASTLSLSGWLAVDTGSGLRSTNAQLILWNRAGARYLIATNRRIRRDLVDRYDNTDLIGSGYAAGADISRLDSGEYLLAPGYEVGGTLYQCPTMQRRITIDRRLSTGVP